ncbi:MAG: nitroreductase family protein [Salinivirgaceae bacterium]|nr:nitroreductase family protein [Salinivirgaceae bacterium]
MEFSELIRVRRSHRKFTTQPVERQKVEAILKAGLLAPSGKSVYPCEFIVVDEPDLLAKIAHAKARGAALVEGASLAVVVVADTSKSDVWVEDASIATTLIMLEAENQGLGACWVQMRLRGTDDGIPATDNLRKLLNLSHEHEVLAVVAIGYKVEEKPARTDSDLKFEKIHHLTL